MLDLLKKTLKSAPIIKRGQYDYFIHPVTDGIPRVEPKLLCEIADEIIKNCGTDFDVIVTMEAMGIHISTALSIATGIPVNIIRKKQYWLPGEVVLDQETGYSKGKLYLNEIKKGDRVLIVDAVISTGGTMVATIGGLEKAGAKIQDIICVIERGSGVEIVKNKTGRDVKTLVKVEVAGSGVNLM
ncbi:MAG: adenine phosphoribosyltransferase [Candidatus Altiarchaeales archaeon IMC4]|nr:MAG: adenine phosphoribosyltransferase [Candidatus Altiarchaeales archaeon IMC4]